MLSRLGFSPELDGEGDAATLRRDRSDLAQRRHACRRRRRGGGARHRLRNAARAPADRANRLRSSAIRSMPCNAPCARCSPAPEAGRRSPTSPSATTTCAASTPRLSNRSGVHAVDLSALDPVAQPASGGPGRAATDAAAEPARHRRGEPQARSAACGSSRWPASIFPPAASCHARRTSWAIVFAGRREPLGRSVPPTGRARLLRSQGDARGADRATRRRR